jgi:hypothetical protein
MPPSFGEFQLGDKQNRIQERLTDFLIDQLTRPLPRYERRGWNDLDALHRHVSPGDVVVVEGDQRISAVIRYLTQSSWSHAALYVGDELLRRDEELRAEMLACFGSDAHHMIIEALLDGVVASPISKYQHLNLRICRPHNLKPHDLKKIIDDAVSSLGWCYDLRNILDLLRYLLPPVRPSRFRRHAPWLGSDVPTEVICTSHLGHLFRRIGFPVAPEIEPLDEAEQLPAGEPLSGLRRLFNRRNEAPYPVRFRERHPSLLTPRDFDLSPWFEVVKFNAIADARFDYDRIRWCDAGPPEEGDEVSE